MRNAGHGICGYIVFGRLADGLYPSKSSGYNFAIKDRKEKATCGCGVGGTLDLRGYRVLASFMDGKYGIMGSGQQYHDSDCF